MNIILLHGEDTKHSFIRLSSFIDESIKRNWKLIKIDNKDSKKLQNIVVENSLFEENKLIIIYGLDLLNSEDKKWIKYNIDKYNTTIVIYETKLLNQIRLNSLPKNIKIEVFQVPKIIYNFLDSLYPGNSKNSLKLLIKLREVEDDDYIFYMIHKIFEDLFRVTNDPSNIPYPSWKVAKLENQASKFNEYEITNVLNKLSDIDYKSKSGLINLITNIDLFIAESLK